MFFPPKLKTMTYDDMTYTASEMSTNCWILWVDNDLLRVSPWRWSLWFRDHFKGLKAIQSTCSESRSPVSKRQGGGLRFAMWVRLLFSRLAVSWCVFLLTLPYSNGPFPKHSKSGKWSFSETQHTLILMCVLVCLMVLLNPFKIFEELDSTFAESEDPKGPPGQGSQLFFLLRSLLRLRLRDLLRRRPKSSPIP